MEDHNKRVILQLEFKNKLIPQKCTKYPNCINTLPKKRKVNSEITLSTLPKKNYIINSWKRKQIQILGGVKLWN